MPSSALRHLSVGDRRLKYRPPNELRRLLRGYDARAIF